MSDAVRGALWANDLSRLRQRASAHGEYELIELPPSVEIARAMGVSDDEARERWARGCRAFGALSWADGAVASWLWVAICDEYAPLIRRTLRMPEGNCYAFDAGTVEAHRGRGLFAALLELAGWRMGREGHHAMWGGILDENLASQRANAAAGFRPVLRLAAVHEPAPGRLRTWPADYADERLVARARRLLGDDADVDLIRPTSPSASRRRPTPGGLRWPLSDSTATPARPESTATSAGAAAPTTATRPGREPLVEKTCSRCGAHIPDGQASCPNCGQS